MQQASQVQQGTSRAHGAKAEDSPLKPRPPLHTKFYRMVTSPYPACPDASPLQLVPRVPTFSCHAGASMSVLSCRLTRSHRVYAYPRGRTSMLYSSCSSPTTLPLSYPFLVPPDSHGRSLLPLVPRATATMLPWRLTRLHVCAPPPHLHVVQQQLHPSMHHLVRRPQLQQNQRPQRGAGVLWVSHAPRQRP